MVVDQKIVDRIKKLFELGTKNSNEHEAELAMERAHALMKEHGIAMAQIKEGSNDELEAINWTSDWMSQIDTYSRLLCSATSSLFGCMNVLIRSSRYNKYRVKMSFIGEETDVALCAEVWPYLVKIAKGLAKGYAGPGWDARHRTFCEAFATRVLARAEQMAVEDRRKSENAQTDQQKADQTYALVLISKDNAIQKWLDKSGMNLKTANINISGEVDHGAALAGDRAGKSVNLNFRKQVGDSGESTRLVR